MQICLNLGLNLLGIPVSMDYYRKICRAVYLAEERKVHISSARVELGRNGKYYSPIVSGGGCGRDSRCLAYDISEMELELSNGLDDSMGWSLSKRDAAILRKLKKDLSYIN